MVRGASYHPSHSVASFMNLLDRCQCSRSLRIESGLHANAILNARCISNLEKHVEESTRNIWQLILICGACHEANQEEGPNCFMGHIPLQLAPSWHCTLMTILTTLLFREPNWSPNLKAFDTSWISPERLQANGLLKNGEASQI